MENVYPGPHCKALKLTCHNIDEGNILVQYKTINNGVVLELYKYLKSDVSRVRNVIQKLCTDLIEINPTILNTKISRLRILRAKLHSKKRCRLGNLEEVLSTNFTVKKKAKKIQVAPDCQPREEEETKTVNDLLQPETTKSNLNDLEKQTGHYWKNVKIFSTNYTVRRSVRKSQVVSDCQPSDIEEREINMTNPNPDPEITKRNDTLCQLSNEISKAKSNLNALKKKLGHYSVENVNNRDKLHRRRLRYLHRCEEIIKDKDVLISNLYEKLDSQKVKLKQLESDNEYLKELCKNANEVLLLNEIKKETY